MKYIGLIGYPLSHSISPAFQQAALDHYKLDAHYVLWEIGENQLKRTVDNIRREENLGANVTVPYKENVIPFLDGLEGDAAAVGAVNVIAKKEGRLEGYNTDVYGFLQALTRDGRFDPEGKRCVVLGAGGVARAAFYALVKSGAAFVGVANRSLPRAESLLKDLARFLKKEQKARAVGLEESRLVSLLREADLVVNCTSVGMKGSAVEKEMPIKRELIPERAMIYDLVYNPAETPFLKEARSIGSRTLGGLPMLVYQGAASFELWTGKKAPVGIMFEAARRALK